MTLTNYLCDRCGTLVDGFNEADAAAEGFDPETCDVLCRQCAAEQAAEYEALQEFSNHLHRDFEAQMENGFPENAVESDAFPER